MSNQQFENEDKENDKNKMNIETNKKQKSEKLKKEIEKLEEIGKKGKLIKVIKISIEFYDYIKTMLNEYTLRILSYIIKGFILSLTKDYNNLIRENNKFLEEKIFKINLTDKIKKSEKKIEKNKIEENFSLKNFSLFQENQLFEKFLENSNMSEIIHKTFEKINENISQINFDNFTEKEKKQFLKENFIKPLIQTCPITSNFFSSMMYFNKEEEENNLKFSDYLNLNENDFFNKDNYQNEDINNFNSNDVYLVKDYKLIEQQLQTKKNICFLFDSKEIEIDINSYLNNIKNINEENEAEEIFTKNYREIMKKVRLEKFKNSLINNRFKIEKIDDLKKYPLIISEYTFNNLCKTCNFKGFGDYVKINNNNEEENNFEENFLNNDSVLKYSNDSSKSFKSFNNINLQNNSNNQSKENIFLNLKNVIQNQIKNVVLSLKNYQDVSLQYICNKVSEEINQFKKVNEKEKCSLIFYNFLCTCQSENIQMKQSEIFGNVFISND